jgi:hypothetical protein
MIKTSDQQTIYLKTFYNTINRLSDVEIESGSADFRLLDKKVVRVMKNFHENEPFLRGLIKWIGFRQVSIEYYPNQRTMGKSKYHFKRMISFALQGVTSFSVRPLICCNLSWFFVHNVAQSCIYHMFTCIPYRKRSFRLGIHYHDYCIFWRLKTH